MGGYLISIIKIGAMTFVIEKSVKVAGKRDFAEVITLAGWSLVGMQVIGLVGFVIHHPPKFISTLGTIWNGLNSMGDWIEKVFSLIGLGV